MGYGIPCNNLKKKKREDVRIYLRAGSIAMLLSCKAQPPLNRIPQTDFLVDVLNRGRDIWIASNNQQRALTLLYTGLDRSHDIDPGGTRRLHSGLHRGDGVVVGMAVERGCGMLPGNMPMRG